MSSISANETKEIDNTPQNTYKTMGSTWEPKLSTYTTKIIFAL